ncbi:hypothetical protein [Staphylococcus xylosus]
MALSEIEMYKKAHKSLSENLKHANNTAQQYKAERDTLIDDIAVVRANSERYRKRAENAMYYAESENCEVLRLERANAELIVASNKYTALTNHIRQKAEHNPGVSRYIDLVNYIDRLEGD